MLVYVHTLLTFWARAASHTIDVRGTRSYKTEAVNAGRFQNPKGPDGRATDSTQYPNDENGPPHSQASSVDKQNRNRFSPRIFQN